jgi:DNA-binding response OmpR family regulator
MKSRECILLVEKSFDHGQPTVEGLIDAGFQVDVAGDGMAAWEALQLCRYNLLITEQFLPKLSGVELIRKIHEARMTLPAIMATSVMPTWEFALHSWLQPTKMLLKPYPFEKLLGLVKTVLPPMVVVQMETAPKPPFHDLQLQPATAGLRPMGMPG